MYAVIECGGKQHRVSEGELLKVEKLDAATGATLTLDQVLLLGAGETVKIGTPYVHGGSVQAEVVSHGRHPKINIVKFRRRKHHRKQMGHRQWFTELKIVSIGGAAAGKASTSTSKNEPKAAPAGKTAAGDDLTRISGVGPVIVEKLAEQGITSFAQIAAFTPDDIVAMDEKLNFKGRIERENWIEQARELMGK